MLVELLDGLTFTTFTADLHNFMHIMKSMNFITFCCTC